MDGTAATSTTAPQTNGQAAPAQQAQAPQVNPTFQQPPVGTPERPAPQYLQIPVEVWQEASAYKQQLAQIQAQQQAAIEAEQQKAIQALAEKGQIEQALEKQRELLTVKEREAAGKLATLQQRYNDQTVNAALAQGLSGVLFAGADEAARGEAARMFAANLRDSLEVVENADGTQSVVEKGTRRPSADVIRERLSDPKLAFFLAPTTRGGSGVDASRPPANPQQQQPGSLEAIAAEYAARQGQYPAFGLGPRTN